MIKEVDLVSYLPPFMAEFKEINITLAAENPEFVLVWNATDEALKNEFIETADEYGISRFERILGMFSSSEDTLESRKSRVQCRWFCRLPYTLKVLFQKLTVLCGRNNFILIKKYDCYKIEVDVSLELFGQIEELEHTFCDMVPCNMIVDIQNKFNLKSEGILWTGGGVCSIETFFVTNDFNEKCGTSGVCFGGAGVVVTEFFEVQNG